MNPSPSAPSEDIADGQSQNGHLATDEELEACYLTDQERTSWEDVKELLVLDHSMKQFVCLLVLSVAIGHEMVNVKKILHGQGKVWEFYFESGKKFIFCRKVLEN